MNMNMWSRLKGGINVALVGVVVLFLIGAANTASAGRRHFDGIEKAPRSRESLLSEYVEMAEEQCALGFTVSRLKGNECLALLKKRRGLCDQEIIRRMPMMVASRPAAIAWAKRHGRCLNL